MRSNQTYPKEDLKLDWEIETELAKVLADEEIVATLQERLEACELTWKIVDNGLLEDI